MPSTEPLHHYLEARDALNRGDRDGAVEELAAAFGTSPTVAMENNLEALLDHGTMPGDVVLDLLRVEVGRSKPLG